jgi:hypothetical protein
VQAIPGKIESLRRLRCIEAGKDVFNPVHEIGPDAATVSALIQPFQTTMLKTPNHSLYSKATITACQIV